MLGRLIEIASKRPVLLRFNHFIILESKGKEFQTKTNLSSEL